ncbi:MAG: SRPBCC domain-containing protein [Calditrichaceae bacterium]
MGTAGIIITATTKTSVEDIWKAWNSLEDIKIWNTASDDWHTPHAEVDLRTGGTFLCRMEVKDGSFGFDFSGAYTNIFENKLIEYVLDDG